MSDKVDERNRRILAAAVALADEKGFRNYSRNDVADRANVAAGSVNNAYGTMDGLHDAVMQYAVDGKLAKIVGEGIAARHPLALAVPQPLKDSALAALAA
jgi:AcrR family transcriptional regulator